MQGGRVDQYLPLNAIRVFTEVGRRLSFSGAAAELHITPSAVSHQIRALEAHLGVSLLKRNGGTVLLTKEGREYLREAMNSLSVLARATIEAKKEKNKRVLRISTGPPFAAFWLMPRLHRFTEAHPGLYLSISSNRPVVDFASGLWDVAFRYTLEPPEGMYHIKLPTNKMIPLCSPKLLKGRHPLQQPSDLRYHTLIETFDEFQYQSTWPAWSEWFRAAGLKEMAGAQSINMMPRILIGQAILSGLGVGLGRTLLAADYLANGELICPFGPAIPLDKHYYFTCRESIRKKPEIVAFRDWVLAEVEQSMKRLKLPPMQSSHLT